MKEVFLLTRCFWIKNGW